MRTRLLAALILCCGVSAGAARADGFDSAFITRLSSAVI